MRRARRASDKEHGISKAQPAVAVVIPIYKQSGLACEAIGSVLCQQSSFEYRLVLVNDGCPYEETDVLCRTYASAHPEAVAYVRKNNGGLSSARNAGVRFALASWPTVQAVAFLDADNRLRPRYLENAYETLRAHPEVGWVFPDIAMFGSERDYCDMSGDYSVLEHLQQNYCEAGSMVRREVFESGVWFDEAMRLGYEDWEFWLQAVEAGFRGRHHPDLGFCYRKRPESMLRDAYRDDQEVRGYIRRKHPRLYSPRRAVALEQSELPRFAIYLVDRRAAALTCDPRRTDRLVYEAELTAVIRRFAAEPQLHSFPPLLVVTTAAALADLVRQGLAPGAFWAMQRGLKDSDLATLAFEQSVDNEWGVAWRSTGPDEAGSAPRHATMAMMATRRVLARLQGDDYGWLDSLIGSKPSARVWQGELTASRFEPPTESGRDAVADLVNLVHRLGAPFSAARALPRMMDARPSRPCRDATRIARAAFGVDALFPTVGEPAGIQAGFVVEVSAEGWMSPGVAEMAHALRENNWTPHLFVSGTGTLRLRRAHRDAFETITPILDSAGEDVGGMEGLLATMDVVVNCGMTWFLPAMGGLRRLGTRTFAYVQPTDSSSANPPGGLLDPWVAFEHGLDGILVSTGGLRCGLAAHGIPSAKLLHVPFAPSHEFSDWQAQASIARREARDGGSPLHVLCTGPVSAQRDLPRLAQLVIQTRRTATPIEWRIAARINGATDGVAEWAIEALRGQWRRPAETSAAAAFDYAWADVVLPGGDGPWALAAINDAQRFGCAVMTDDGAASDEFIIDGHDGYLLRADLDSLSWAQAALARLIELQRDRSAPASFGRRASASAGSRSWNRSIRHFECQARAMCRAEARS